MARFSCFDSVLSGVVGTLYMTAALPIVAAWGLSLDQRTGTTLAVIVSSVDAVLVRLWRFWAAAGRALTLEIKMNRAAAATTPLSVERMLVRGARVELCRRVTLLLLSICIFRRKAFFQPNRSCGNMQQNQRYKQRIALCCDLKSRIGTKGFQTSCRAPITTGTFVLSSHPSMSPRTGKRPKVKQMLGIFSEPVSEAGMCFG